MIDAEVSEVEETPKAQARRLLSQDPIPILPGYKPPSPVTGPLLLDSLQKSEPKRASTAI